MDAGAGRAAARSRVGRRAGDRATDRAGGGAPPLRSFAGDRDVHVARRLAAARYGHGVFGGQIRVSLARAARYPDPTADRGTHAVNLAVFPHGPGLTDVIDEAQRFTMPLRVVEGNAPSAPRPLVTLTGHGVE